MGMSGLPDMSTQSQRVTDPRVEGGHIRQATSARVTTITVTLLLQVKMMNRVV